MVCKRVSELSREVHRKFPAAGQVSAGSIILGFLTTEEINACSQKRNDLALLERRDNVIVVIHSSPLQTADFGKQICEGRQAGICENCSGLKPRDSSLFPIEV